MQLALLKANIKRLLRRSSRGEREPLFLEMLTSALEDGMSVVEIGSDDGRETVLALQSGKRALHLYLIEPDANNLRSAQAAVKRAAGSSALVQFFHCGISATPGRQAFYCHRKSPNLNTTRPLAAADFEKTEADFITLAQFIEQQAIKPPLLLKMDIEGQEVEVLKGGLDFLEQNRHIKILMEVHPEVYDTGHSLADVLKRLFAAGYRTTLLESAGLPIPTPFRARGLVPVKVQHHRGLYQNPPEDIVLEFACNAYYDSIDYGVGVTARVVRSLLIEKD